MRASDQRYAKDRRALDVAVRMIDFEARTSTIRELTGLSDGRIRSLNKSSESHEVGPRLRHRGSSPHRVQLLLGKPRTRNEAAALLSLCQLMGLAGFGISDSNPVLRGLARSERLCDVFWTFRYLLPEASIGFEHMLLILKSAAKGEELRTAHCRGCKALLVVDPLSLSLAACPNCEDSGAGRRRIPEGVPYLKVAEDAAVYG